MKVGGKPLSIDDIGRSDMDRIIEDVINPSSYKREGVGIRVTGNGQLQVKENASALPLAPATSDAEAREIGVEAWYIAEDWANNKPLHLSNTELCHGVANSILKMLDKGHGRVPPMILTPKLDEQRIRNNYVTNYDSDIREKLAWDYDKPIEPTQSNAYSASHAKTYDDWRDRPSISAKELFD